MENTSERHIGAEPDCTGRFFHGFKGRLFRHACPDGAGPVAMLHTTYHATHHHVVPIAGEVADRYEAQGSESPSRFILRCETSGAGAVLTSYDDTTLLGYRPNLKPDLAERGSRRVRPVRRRKNRQEAGRAWGRQTGRPKSRLG